MGRARQISKQEAATLFKDDMSIMVGGFMTNGTSELLMDAVVESGANNLTGICNDAGYQGKGIGKLIDSRQMTTLIASHVGLNKVCGQQYSAGELNLILTPQGTMAEQIKCGGSGLGGFLTPTGLGTLVEEGKKVIEVDGVEYLLEKPLKADIAILKGFKVDESGNVFYRGSTRNFNDIMGRAADTVIVEAENLVKAGEIQQECVHTPGIFIDYIVVGGTK